jgi:hypothetical protein
LALLLRQGLLCDLLLLSGGVSVGRYDLVEKLRVGADSSSPGGHSTREAVVFGRITLQGKTAVLGYLETPYPQW